MSGSKEILDKLLANKNTIDFMGRLIGSESTAALVAGTLSADDAVKAINDKVFDKFHSSKTPFLNRGHQLLDLLDERYRSQIDLKDPDSVEEMKSYLKTNLISSLELLHYYAETKANAEKAAQAPASEAPIDPTLPPEEQERLKKERELAAATDENAKKAAQEYYEKSLKAAHEYFALLATFEENLEKFLRDLPRKIDRIFRRRPELKYNEEAAAQLAEVNELSKEYKDTMAQGLDPKDLQALMVPEYALKTNSDRLEQLAPFLSTLNNEFIIENLNLAKTRQGPFAVHFKGTDDASMNKQLDAAITGLANGSKKELYSICSPDTLTKLSSESKGFHIDLATAFDRDTMKFLNALSDGGHKLLAEIEGPSGSDAAILGYIKVAKSSIQTIRQKINTELHKAGSKKPNEKGEKYTFNAPSFVHNTKGRIEITNAHRELERGAKFLPTTNEARVRNNYSAKIQESLEKVFGKAGEYNEGPTKTVGEELAPGQTRDNLTAFRNALMESHKWLENFNGGKIAEAYAKLEDFSKSAAASIDKFKEQQALLSDVRANMQTAFGSTVEYRMPQDDEIKAAYESLKDKNLDPEVAKALTEKMDALEAERKYMTSSVENVKNSFLRMNLDMSSVTSTKGLEDHIYEVEKEVAELKAGGLPERLKVSDPERKYFDDSRASSTLAMYENALNYYKKFKEILDNMRTIKQDLEKSMQDIIKDVPKYEGAPLKKAFDKVFLRGTREMTHTLLGESSTPTVGEMTQAVSAYKKLAATVGQATKILDEMYDILTSAVTANMSGIGDLTSSNIHKLLQEHEHIKSNPTVGNAENAQTTREVDSGLFRYINNYANAGDLKKYVEDVDQFANFINGLANLSTIVDKLDEKLNEVILTTLGKKPKAKVKTTKVAPIAEGLKKMAAEMATATTGKLRMLLKKFAAVDMYEQMFGGRGKKEIKPDGKVESSPQVLEKAKGIVDYDAARFASQLSSNLEHYISAFNVDIQKALESRKTDHLDFDYVKKASDTLKELSENVNGLKSWADKAKISDFDSMVTMVEKAADKLDEIVQGWEDTKESVPEGFDEDSKELLTYSNDNDMDNLRKCFADLEAVHSHIARIKAQVTKEVGGHINKITDINARSAKIAEDIKDWLEVARKQVTRGFITDIKVNELNSILDSVLSSFKERGIVGTPEDTIKNLKDYLKKLPIEKIDSENVETYTDTDTGLQKEKKTPVVVQGARMTDLTLNDIQKSTDQLSGILAAPSYTKEIDTLQSNLATFSSHFDNIPDTHELKKLVEDKDTVAANEPADAKDDKDDRSFSHVHSVYGDAEQSAALSLIHKLAGAWHKQGKQGMADYIESFHGKDLLRNLIRAEHKLSDKGVQSTPEEKDQLFALHEVLGQWPDKGVANLFNTVNKLKNSSDPNDWEASSLLHNALKQYSSNTKSNPKKAIEKVLAEYDSGVSGDKAAVKIQEVLDSDHGLDVHDQMDELEDMISSGSAYSVTQKRAAIEAKAKAIAKTIEGMHFGTENDDAEAYKIAKNALTSFKPDGKTSFRMYLSGLISKLVVRPGEKKPSVSQIISAIKDISAHAGGLEHGSTKAILDNLLDSKDISQHNVNQLSKGMDNYAELEKGGEHPIANILLSNINKGMDNLEAVPSKEAEAVAKKNMDKHAEEFGRVDSKMQAAVTRKADLQRAHKKIEDDAIAHSSDITNTEAKIKDATSRKKLFEEKLKTFADKPAAAPEVVAKASTDIASLEKQLKEFSDKHSKLLESPEASSQEEAKRLQTTISQINDTKHGLEETVNYASSYDKTKKNVADLDTEIGTLTPKLADLKKVDTSKWDAEKKRLTAAMDGADAEIAALKPEHTVAQQRHADSMGKHVLLTAPRKGVSPKLGNGNAAVRDYAKNMLKDVQKARKERAALMGDKDPVTGEAKTENKGAIEQLSKTIDDRMRTLAEFHGHAAAGLAGDPTNISQQALEHHISEARKAKQKKEALTNYASQMDMANAQTGDRKEESLKRAKEIADSEGLYDASGNIINGEGLGAKVSEHTDKASAIDTFLRDTNPAHKSLMSYGAPHSNSKIDLGGMVGVDRHTINISSQTGSEGHVYKIPEADDFLRDWADFIKFTGSPTFFDPKAFKVFLQQSLVKLGKKMRGSYSTERIGGFEQDGVKYPGLIDELTTEKKNRQQDLEDLELEEKEITQSLIPLMEDLADVLEQSGNMDQKVRNNLDSVVHTIDSEALNQKIEEDMRRGVIPEGESEQKEFTTQVLEHINNMRSARKMPASIYQAKVKVLKDKLESVVSGQTRKGLKLDTDERLMVGTHEAAELERLRGYEVQELATQILQKNSALFHDFNEVGNRTRAKLTKLSGMLGKGLSESIEADPIEFTPEEYEVMGTKLENKVKGILDGTIKGKGVQLGNFDNTIARVASNLNKNKIKTEGIATPHDNLLFKVKNLMQEVEEENGSFETTKSNLDKELSDGLITDAQRQEAMEALFDEHEKVLHELNKKLDSLHIMHDVKNKDVLELIKLAKIATFKYDGKAEGRLNTKASADAFEASLARMSGRLSSEDQRTVLDLEKDVEDYRDLIGSKIPNDPTMENTRNKKLKDLSERIDKRMKKLKDASMPQLDELSDAIMHFSQQGKINRRFKHLNELFKNFGDLTALDRDTDGSVFTDVVLNDKAVLEALKELGNQYKVGYEHSLVNPYQMEDIKKKVTSSVTVRMQQLSDVAATIKQGLHNKATVTKFAKAVAEAKDKIQPYLDAYLTPKARRQLYSAERLAETPYIKAKVLHNAVHDSRTLENADTLMGSLASLDDNDALTEKEKESVSKNKERLLAELLQKTQGIRGAAEVMPDRVPDNKLDVVIENLENAHPELLEAMPNGGGQKLIEFKDWYRGVHKDGKLMKEAKENIAMAKSLISSGLSPEGEPVGVSTTDRGIYAIESKLKPILNSHANTPENERKLKFYKEEIKDILKELDGKKVFKISAAVKEVENEYKPIMKKCAELLKRNNDMRAEFIDPISTNKSVRNEIAKIDTRISDLKASAKENKTTIDEFKLRDLEREKDALKKKLVDTKDIDQAKLDALVEEKKSLESVVRPLQAKVADLQTEALRLDTSDLPNFSPDVIKYLWEGPEKQKGAGLLENVEKLKNILNFITTEVDFKKHDENLKSLEERAHEKKEQEHEELVQSSSDLESIFGEIKDYVVKGGSKYDPAHAKYEITDTARRILVTLGKLYGRLTDLVDTHDKAMDEADKLFTAGTISEEEHNAKIEELDDTFAAEEKKLFGDRATGKSVIFSDTFMDSMGASDVKGTIEKMSEILSSFLHALPKAHPARGKYAAIGSSDNTGNFGPGERKEDLIKQKNPPVEFSDTMGQSGKSRKGLSGIQDKTVHKALAKSLDGIYKRMLKKPFAETRPEHLVPVDSLTRTGDDILGVLHGLRETTALRKGYDTDFDSLASQYHAVKSHAKSVENEGPGSEPLNKTQAELAKRIEGSWKRAGERLRVAAGELARRTTSAKSANELDYLRKSHASVMSNLEKHKELTEKGADYEGDTSHQIAKELHENTLALERFLDKGIALKGRKGTGYKAGDKVTPREALAQLMERQKQLDDIRRKITRRKEDVQKKIDGLDAQIEGWTHDLNYGKKHGGVGIDNVTQQRWAKAFLSMLMHNFMWIWDRNMEAFERQFNARASEYYKFLDDHRDILGTFNNGRVSKATTFVSDLLRDPERLPTKYRSVTKTEEMKHLLDLRRKLFLYKYSLANIGVLTTGFEDYADEQGITIKDGIAEMTKYDTELQHKETATEAELAQAVDNFKRSNPELVADLEQQGVVKKAAMDAEFSNMGFKAVTMRAIHKIADMFSKGA